MKKFLAVGDNAMPGNELQECVHDARFYIAMAYDLGISADNRIDRFSTKAEVWDWQMDAQKQAIAGDLTYCGLAISNHGTHQMVNGMLEGAICCYDMRQEGDNWWPGGLITASEFQSWANGFPLACRVEVFLDICYSFAETKAMRRWNSKAIHNPGNSAGLLRMADKPVQSKLNSNVVVWAACSEAEEAADAPALGNGAFTALFKKVWTANPKASRIEIIGKVRPAIHAAGYPQTARLACYNDAGQLPVGM